MKKSPSPNKAKSKEPKSGSIRKDSTPNLPRCPVTGKIIPGPGVPSKYDPKYCDMIIEAGKRGDALVEFASSIGVHVDTLHEWASKYPAFSESKKLAKQFCEAFYLEVGKMGLLGQTVKQGRRVMNSFNTPVWIFMMKARFGYREDAQREDDLTDLEIV